MEFKIQAYFYIVLILAILILCFLLGYFCGHLPKPTKELTGSTKSTTEEHNKSPIPTTYNKDETNNPSNSADNSNDNNLSNSDDNSNNSNEIMSDSIEINDVYIEIAVDPDENCYCLKNIYSIKQCWNSYIFYKLTFKVKNKHSFSIYSDSISYTMSFDKTKIIINKKLKWDYYIPPNKEIVLNYPIIHHIQEYTNTDPNNNEKIPDTYYMERCKHWSSLNDKDLTIEGKITFNGKKECIIKQFKNIENK